MKLTEGFNLLATATDGIKRLRELILTLAVQGKLVPQDANDEPASELLKQIRAEKDRLIAEGKIKKDKIKEVSFDDAPYELPEKWSWTTISEIITSIGSGWSPACLSEPQSTAEQWAVLKTTAVQLMEYQAHQNKLLPSTLVPRPEIETQNGDILITRAGPRNRVGISCLVQNTPPRLMISDKIVRFHVLDDLIDAQFIVLCLNAGWSYQCLDAAKSGMAESQVNISQGDLRNIPVPLCTKTEQSRIVAKVEELMALCDALETRGKLEAKQHTRLTATLFDALAASESAHQLQENWTRLAQSFDLILDRPAAVDAFEQTLLQLAVRGLLVEQDPNDEPASELLKQIRAEKDRLIAEGKIKKDKPLPSITDEEKPFNLPQGWEWVRFGDIASISSGVTLGRKTAIPDPILLPYLRVANVQRWKLVLHDVKELIIDESELERFSLKHGDLLITEGGDWDKVGRTCVWEENLPTCLHQNHVFKVRATYSEWNYRWAELYLNSNDARAYFASSAKQTTNLASINMTQLKNCLFPMPPLAVQSRIIARVEALRALCTDLRQRLTASQKSLTHLAETLVEQAA
ncbi:restriction endonuclease subunit S [Iodobacter arcticus]|uniref:Restriction endonuclease subunit S n=1 Tax=Iodobacter arcticus TaxID=590593 RepID=A0ABW2QT59_9NEIS